MDFSSGNERSARKRVYGDSLKSGVLIVYFLLITNRIGQLRINYGITQKTWKRIVQDITTYMVLENIFPVLTENIVTDCIVHIMKANKILRLDNNHQELYKKVSLLNIVLVYLYF